MTGKCKFLILYKLNSFQTFFFFKFSLINWTLEILFFCNKKATKSNFFINQKQINWGHMESHTKLLGSDYVSLCLVCTVACSSRFSDYQSDNVFI